MRTHKKNIEAARSMTNDEVSRMVNGRRHAARVARSKAFVTARLHVLSGWDQKTGKLHSGGRKRDAASIQFERNELERALDKLDGVAKPGAAAQQNTQEPNEEGA